VGESFPLRSKIIPPFASHIHTGFITINNRSCANSFFNRIFCLRKSFIAFMARLSATFSAGFLPQVSWHRSINIAGRRLTTVMAVFNTLCFEFRNFFLKCIDFINQHFNKRNNSVFALTINIYNFIARKFTSHNLRNYSVKLLLNNVQYGTSACLVPFVKILYFKEQTGLYIVV
jgi:hypothetical protein